MDRTERFYRIDRLLRANPVVPIFRFMDDLGVSRATFKRDLEYMRDRLDAPIQWDSEKRGYCYAGLTDSALPHYLPGLWLSPEELTALLSVEHLIESMEPGLLSRVLAPFRERIGGLLGNPISTSAEIRERIRILPIASRVAPPAVFAVVADGLIRRQRLRIVYCSHGLSESTERAISPQRLVNYRDNWYVDAWCHLRKALRTFALDGIQSAATMQERAREVSSRKLDQALGAGYGIFSGPIAGKAELRFTPECARWVAREIWHPKQTSGYDAEGYYLLRFPYSDLRELVMDILRYGKSVEVLAPKSLRQAVASALELALGQYRK